MDSNSFHAKRDEGCCCLGCEGKLMTMCVSLYGRIRYGLVGLLEKFRFTRTQGLGGHKVRERYSKGRMWKGEDPSAYNLIPCAKFAEERFVVN